MINETLHPIKKAAALRRGLVVASNKMNTTIVAGDTLASRPRSPMAISRLMGYPGLRAGA
jgi:thiamine monophosphate kinase